MSLDFTALRRNDILGAIGALVMASRRGSVREVFTFNYDDILERYLSYHGLVVSSTIDLRFWASNADVVVHHPHGFLPYRGSDEAKRSVDITLDATSYALTTGKPDDRWNQKMATTMQANTCLFVGISGDDIRMHSLMLESEPKHAYKQDEDGYWGVAFGLPAARASAWEEKKLYLQHLTDYRQGLPEFLFQICQRAAKLSKASS